MLKVGVEPGSRPVHQVEEGIVLAVEKELTGILRDKSGSEEAMDRVALAWEAITDDLDRDRQLAAYRASMDLAGPPGGPRPGQGGRTQQATGSAFR